MTFQTLNPATGELLTTFDYLSDSEVQAALDTADACYRQDWRHRSVAERAQVVRRAAEILRENADEYAGYLTLEMGKLAAQAQFEVGLSADILTYYADNAETFLKPQPLVGVPGSVVVTEPIGVLVGIEPWNFPYYQLARVAGPQLVAGNVVLMKHAPSVPQCALAFARLFEQAGAPAGAYTNLFCSVEQIGNVIDDFRVRGVMLTGSERAGAAVAERAGRALKKVVLELGGSDPMIVLEDTPIDKAVQLAAGSRLLNMGQACAATKRLIVVGKERARQIVAGLTEVFNGMRAGNPNDPETTIGPLFSEAALEKLLDQIRRAEATGAAVVTGGKRIDRPGFYLQPTIITNIDSANPLHREEAFGPVLGVYAVDSEEEAIAVANDSPYGLGSAVLCEDVERAQRIAARIEAGMVFINSGVYTGPETPFGGVKNSGFGRELGEAGIGEFVNRKLIRVAASA
ncbi:NAD-dependent succinate-semialdehyde dehydrogenase [Pseudomonas aeruginosa]|uniref:NAD-dependent succinate-semialdehyde dehydrogenase n=1 Tax=Pseudomonas aeruginosa TaxID=287 RepID=UPI000936456C|nr:NAD-dependent succinate-semialdehyde dehydrogenase [Pseudomonas aeruginosa]HDR3017806.1 NAD-dependent succinate-semialdehyde dehydrogenase [Pseudomonas aeruginosa]